MAKPGAIGLVPVRGLGGFGIQLGELLVDRHDGAQHAFILLDDGTVLEAEPKGARIAPLAHCAGPIVWLDPPLHDSTRDVIVKVARTYEGCKYSWWAYLWLACNRFGLHPAWLRSRVDDPHWNMCSQLVDRIWRQAAGMLPELNPDRRWLHLFDDGRDCGNVTPGDLRAVAENPPWGRDAATS